MISSPATSLVILWIAFVVSVIAVSCDKVVILRRDALENNIIDDNEFSDKTIINETIITIPLTTTRLLSEQIDDFGARYAIGK